MMTSNQILLAIEEIAATSSKNEKQALVTKYAKDKHFQDVLEYAYNPFKTYGIAKHPGTVGEHVGNEFDDGTWELLDALIKRELTGNAAIEAIRGELTALSEESADLLFRIIRKDLRAGFSESTCNKAVKGLIPEFPYMRCSLPKDAKFDEWDWALGVFSQEKADGMFANVNHEAGGIVNITSRQGSPFPLGAFAELVEDVQTRLAKDTQTHGEMLVERNGVVLPREIGNGILNSILSGGSFEEGDRPVFVVWDQIPLSAVVPKGKCDDKYVKRLNAIMNQLKAPGASIRLIETRVYHSLTDAYKHYRELLAKGKEGTIIKNPKGIWRDGTSKDQIKLKLEADVDLKVVAIVPGKEGGKNDGRAGSLTCVTSCGQLQVDVTVKNEKMRDHVDKYPESWFDSIIVVRANSIMPPSASSDKHSLFLPRMVEAEYRTDKSEADSLQRVIDQFEAAIKAA